MFPQTVLVLFVALANPIVSFRRSCWFIGRLRTSSLFTERESSEVDSDKTPLTQFMDAFFDSLRSTHSFQKITLTEPVDDGLVLKYTKIDGRMLKEKNMLQLAFAKGKNVLRSSNYDIDDGISFIQRCLQV